ncbi:MAG: glycosyltransferase [Planctomycetota bacterium]
METSLPKDPGTDPESPARTSAAAGFRGLAQRLVYRARRWGGLTIVAMFRGLLGAADLLHLGARRRRRAPVAWPADRPLVSVLVAPDASLGEQTITGLQQVSGELPDALTQAQGKYLAVVPTGCTCDPSLLEKALLMLEAGPELGFVCAFPGGDAAPLDTQEILARAHRDPEQVAAMILRPALTDVAVPRATNVPALLQLVHEAVWEGVVLREPLVQIPRGDREDAVVPGAAATVAAAQQRRHPFLRLLPEALGVGLREAWRDHVRASRGGAAQNLVDYGRDLRTRAPDRRVVLWLVPWLRAGGVEAVLRNLLEGLGTDYHFVLCPTIDIDHDWRDRFTELGSEVYVLPELLPRRSWPAFLERLIQAKRPQVLVNTHSQYGYDVAAWLRRRLPGLRAYDLLHNDSELGFIRHAAKHDASYDGHVVVSDRIGTTLVEQYGVDPARVHTIANGIDVHGRFDPERYPPRASGGDPDSDFVVGYVGRLAEEKDPWPRRSGTGSPCMALGTG